MATAERAIKIVPEFRPDLDFSNMHFRERFQLKVFGLGFRYEQADGTSCQMVLFRSPYRRDFVTRFALYDNTGLLIAITTTPMTRAEHKAMKLEKESQKRKAQSGGGSLSRDEITYGDISRGLGIKEIKAPPLKSMLAGMLGYTRFTAFSDGTYGAKVVFGNPYMSKEHSRVNIGAVLDAKLHEQHLYALSGTPLLSGKQYGYIMKQQGVVLGKGAGADLMESEAEDPEAMASDAFKEAKRRAKGFAEMMAHRDGIRRA